MEPMQKPGFVNFLAGNVLNRLSWKRRDNTFIHELIRKNSLWIVFNGGQPLVRRTIDDRTKGLAYLPFGHLSVFFGDSSIFEPQDERDKEGPQALECARVTGPRLVFLGVHLPNNPKSKDFQSILGNGSTKIEHTSYFAVDLGDEIDDKNQQTLLQPLDDDGTSLEFVEPRGATMSFSPFDAGLFAEAKSLVDWNKRNKFCPACGSPNYSLWAGWKLACTTLLPATDLQGQKPCPSSTGLQNYVHPRTDPVVIVAVIDPRGNKILLGRNKRFPRSMFSCLAGFLEPGESLEEAVKREVMEESGISVTGVQYHSAQPWPYPANLMLGCYAVAENENVQLIDGELEEAQFFERNKVLQILAHPKGAIIRRTEYKKFDEQEPDQAADAGSGTRDKTADEPEFRVPPVSAIAGVLISEWAYGRISLPRPSL